MKKKKVLDIAGMSIPGCIDFFGEKGSVSVDTEDYKIPPRYTKETGFKLLGKVKNIPFIRGLAIIINIILAALRLIWKNKVWLVLMLIIVAYIFLAPEKTVVEKISEPGPLSSIIPDTFWSDYLFPIGFYATLLTFIFLATKNHGAEHKVISAYETTQDISLKNIKKQPKENKRCGTVLVVWFLILTSPLYFFNWSDFIKLIFQLFMFSTAYELFLLARKENIIGKSIFFFGWLGQKLTTREPDDKLLLIARQGLIRLLDEEGYNYKK